MDNERRIDISQKAEIHIPRIEINAENLYRENHSELADSFREVWNNARRNGNLTVTLRCSDARLKSIGSETVSVGSVAAAIVPSEQLLVDRGSARGVVLTHFDGDTVKPGEMPRGCGGLQAKGDESSVEGTEIAPYIGQQIADKDPFIQSVLTAEEMAWKSDKPVVAWAIDHITDEITPIAYYKRRPSGSMLKISALKDSDISDYNAERIYADGLPSIPEIDLPDEFIRLIDQNKTEQIALVAKYPNIREIQKKQRTPAVLLSTDIRPAKKFGRIGMEPGSLFKIFAGRDKNGDSATIDQEIILNSFRQLWYPIYHAVEHANQPNESFSGTNRIIIETPDLTVSKRIAEMARQKEWVQKWFETQRDPRIILLQTNAGIINDTAEII